MTRVNSSNRSVKMELLFIEESNKHRFLCCSFFFVCVSVVSSVSFFWHCVFLFPPSLVPREFSISWVPSLILFMICFISDPLLIKTNIWAQLFKTNDVVS